MSTIKRYCHHCKELIGPERFYYIGNIDPTPGGVCKEFLFFHIKCFCERFGEEFKND